MDKVKSEQDLFNLDILYLNKDSLKYIQEVKVMDIMLSNTQTFNPEGLFSTEIFGPLGNTLRNEKFGYISLGIPIMHPLIFKSLMQLSSLYQNIAHGYKYATFDKKLGDFVLSNYEDGETGYDFFIKHVPLLKLDDRGSDQREHKIKLVKQNIDKIGTMSHFLVLPAGLRDYTVDEAGSPSEDEVNNIYRKLMATCNILKNTSVKPAEYKQFDKIRVKIQNITLELYDHFRLLIDGKKKFVLGKFAKRGVADGTRNVITPAPVLPNDLDDENLIGINDTTIGLYQFVKAISPITKNKLHSKFITRIFNPETTSALLIDPKSLKSTLVEVPIKKRDEWLSLEGLDGVMNKLSQEDLRVSPVKVDKYYLMLIYDDGKTIELIFNTDYISSELDPKHIRPLTYAELFYLSVYDIRDKYPGYLTRYPVDNMGSIYPTSIYLKTTVVGRKVNLRFNNQLIPIVEYPILTEKFVMSTSPSVTRLKGLGADFDG